MKWWSSAVTCGINEGTRWNSYILQESYLLELNSSNTWAPLLTIQVTAVTRLNDDLEVREQLFDWIWDFSTTFRRRRNLFFNSEFKLFDDASEFSVTSLYFFYFLFKFMLIFLQSLQFSIGTRAIVRSSTILLSKFCFLVKLLCIGPVLRRFHL